MKRKVFRITAVILLAGSIILLTACQMRPGAGRSGPGTVAGLSATSVQVTEEPTLTPRPLATRKPRPTATPTQDVAKVKADQAEQAARAYFAELEKGNSE